MQMPEEPKLLSKVAVQETQGKGSKVPHYNESEVTEANPGLQDNGFELNKVSPVCIRVCKLDVMIIIMIINTFFCYRNHMLACILPHVRQRPFPSRYIVCLINHQFRLHIKWPYGLMLCRDFVFLTDFEDVYSLCSLECFKRSL